LNKLSMYEAWRTENRSFTRVVWKLFPNPFWVAELFRLPMQSVLRCRYKTRAFTSFSLFGGFCRGFGPSKRVPDVFSKQNYVSSWFFLFPFTPFGRIL
jgi:hypothetical protein